jgi:surface antigen
MDINKFVAEWNGKYNNEDGVYGPQCVDIVKEWEKENGWVISHGNAIDYAKGEPGFTWTPNTSTGVPPAGALVVFQVGEYGHIAIALSGSNDKTLITFEQNDPLGSVCHIHNYNYLNPRCLGWLHK